MIVRANNDYENSPSNGKVVFHRILDGEGTKDWIHTHGMNVLNLPELEIRGVPAFLTEAAARLLRSVCDYMIESGVAVKPGENMAVSDRTIFSFIKPAPIPGQEGHYEVERLQIVELDRHTCDGCGA